MTSQVYPGDDIKTEYSVYNHICNGGFSFTVVVDENKEQKLSIDLGNHGSFLSVTLNLNGNMIASLETILNIAKAQRIAYDIEDYDFGPTPNDGIKYFDDK